MFWFAAIAFVVSIAVLAAGLRGRRFGRSPHCGWCNAALSSEPTENCSSCGGSLKTGPGIRRGKWRRMPVLIALGGAGLVLIGGGSILAMNATNPAWIRVAPTSLLTLQTRHLAPPARDAAGEELLRRHQSHPLPADILAVLARPALDAMHDDPSNWDHSVWRPLLDAAFAAEAVDHELTIRCLQLILGDLKLDFPQRVLANELVWEEWSSPAPEPTREVTYLPTGGLTVGASLLRASLDGSPLPVDFEPVWDDHWNLVYDSYSVSGDGFGSSRSHSSGNDRADFATGRLVPWAASPGPHELRLRWKVYARQEAADRTSRMRDLQDGRRPQRTPFREEDFPFTWEVETVSRFTAFNSPKEMIRLLTTADGVAVDAGEISAEFDVSTGWMQEGDGPRQVTHDLRLDITRRGNDQTIDAWIVGRIELRSADRVWPLYERPPYRDNPGEPTFVALEPMESHGSTSHGFGLDWFPDVPRTLGKINVVILPDIDYAADLQEPAAIWGEEIVIKDVPLDWSKIAPAIDQ